VKEIGPHQNINVFSSEESSLLPGLSGLKSGGYGGKLWEVAKGRGESLLPINCEKGVHSLLVSEGDLRDGDELIKGERGRMPFP